MPDIKKIKAKPLDADTVIMDRSKPFDGKCELCHKEDDLRPYGANDEWICYDCGLKNPELTEKQMEKHVFGYKH